MRTVADAQATRMAIALLLPAALLVGGLAISLKPAEANPQTGFTTVNAGDSHTCGVTSTGALKCWGRNNNGQLGDGLSTDRSYPANVAGMSSGIASVSGGARHTCALTTAGGVKCWGHNESGQLGDGTTITRTTPVDVLGLTSGVASVAAGDSHTCARTTAGGLKCWGRNANYQLGNGTNAGSATPVDVVGLSSGVVALAAGDVHTCAVTAAGGVRCWGDNSLGQLGDGTTVAHSIPTDVVGLASGVASIAAGGTHSCARTTAGALKCWGGNFLGQLGDGSTADHHTPALILASGVSEVTTGLLHTCVLSTGGSVKCWGSNQFGQLGDGSTTNRTAPANVLGLGGGVAMVDAGGRHTCALLADSTIKCWGLAADGQLGDGRFLVFAAISTSPLTVVIALEKPTPTATPCPGSGCATPTPTPTPQPGSGIDFSIGIDVDGDSVDDCNTSGGPGMCSISAGAVFRLKVYLNDLPTQTPIYDGVQVYLSYNGLLAKSGTANNDAWPDCAFPVSYYGNQFVAFACADLKPSSYRGEIGGADFTCTQSGDITLVNGPGYTELSRALNYSEVGNEQLHVDCVVVPSPTPKSVGGLAHDVQLGGAPRGTLVAAISSFALLLALIAGAAWIGRRGSL